MIPIEKEKRIRSLLSEGLPCREIARRMKVAPATVGIIRKQPELRHRRRMPEKLPKLKEPQQCPTCRGMITISPCLLCHPEVGDYDEK